MKKLTKQQLATRRDLIAKLEIQSAALQSAVDVYNAAIASYNAVLSEAREMCDDILSTMEEYFDGRSESWQESDKAQSYSAWQDAWNEIVLDDLDQLDPVDLTHRDELAALPEAPDE